ncbi:MAG: fatty acid desaturase family protein [Rhizobiaceae bacterium]
MSDTALNQRTSPAVRDYSLTGASARRAIEAGLSAAQWYHSDVPRKTIKALMKRRDGPAIRDTALWIALHIIFAGGGIYFWGSWISVPFWFAYGVLYGSACDSRWHECGHGTAFRTRWMNDVVYHIASFQIMRNPVNWRWSHARHHTDTLIVGRDPEIAWMHPINLVLKTLAFVGIYETWLSLVALSRHAMGRLSDDERDYIPESQWPDAYFWARIHMGIYVLVVMTTIVMLAGGAGWAAVIPLLLIGGPRVYGCWHFVMTGLLQHGGLPEDVIDHRLNSRTLYMNPVSRWLYWNMNYHVEHHMYPMVPYYALPALHEEIKDDLPAPNRSIWDAYREMMQAIMIQRKNPDYVFRRPLPPTAKPYKENLHQVTPERPVE